ncbi:hypothetical protein D3C81_1499310 [compost metagenome]
MLALAGLGHVEGVLEDAVDATAGEHRFLQHELVLGAFEHAPAQRRVLAFGVFADDHEVDVAGFTTSQRAGYAGEQAHRANVHVLVEVAAELEQRTPQRDVVRDLVGPADRAEVQGVEVFELLEPVVRHHLAVGQVVIAAGPLEEFEADVQAVLASGSLDYADTFGEYFDADAVTGDGCDSECFGHGAHSLSREQVRAML